MPRDLVDRMRTVSVAFFDPAQEVEAEPGQLRAGAHTDYGCMTILAVEDVPGGLEVLARNGE